MSRWWWEGGTDPGTTPRPGRPQGRASTASLPPEEENPGDGVASVQSSSGVREGPMQVGIGLGSCETTCVAAGGAPEVCVPRALWAAEELRGDCSDGPARKTEGGVEAEEMKSSLHRD